MQGHSVLKDNDEHLSTTAAQLPRCTPVSKNLALSLLDLHKVHNISSMIYCTVMNFSFILTFIYMKSGTVAY